MLSTVKLLPGLRQTSRLGADALIVGWHLQHMCKLHILPIPILSLIPILINSHLCAHFRAVYMAFCLTNGKRWIFGLVNRASGDCFRTPEIYSDLKKDGPTRTMKHLFYWVRRTSSGPTLP